MVSFLTLECGRTYQENADSFESPDYTDGEPPPEGTKCEWRITATHGERIVLEINKMDIYQSEDCQSDYIEIRDGYWHKSDLLGN